MNKKFSTLLTTTLFLGGALFSEAYAQSIKEYIEDSPVTEIESGAKYILVQNTGSTSVFGGGAVVGIDKYDVDTKKVTYGVWGLDYTADFSDKLEGYIWTVEEKDIELFTGKKRVTFTNEEYGLGLNIMKDGSALVTDYNTAADQYSNWWIWGSAVAYKDNSDQRLYGGETAIAEYLKSATPTNLKLLNCNKPSSFYTWGLQDLSNATPVGTYSLYKIKDQVVSDEDLNKLYNSAGFNFKIKDGVDNIFADQRIKAIKVNNPLYSSTSNQNFGFPAGTYFVTETPAGSYDQATSPYDYLLNCTFIALSASDNASTSAAKQKTGEGFTLTTVKGKDLNLFIADKQSVIDATPAEQQTSGSTISVLNAAFTVKTNVINSKDKYALSLDRVRIQEATGNAKHVYKENIIIDIKSDASYNSDEVLVSYPSTTQSFIFEFVASNVVEGKKFLNENGAAIYNIQFVGGDADGLYLTNAYNGNATPANFAKGIAIADLNTPAFQYVVTEVDGNNVTFTNRETGKAFTTQLFEEEGTDTYSLALDANSATNDFTILNIKDNGNIEAAGSTTDLNLAWVKLTKVASVDKFAGFLNVEDGTNMTLTFARDLDPTSNKLYPVVTKDNSNVFVLDNSKLTDKVEEAAQWQLIKTSEKPSYKTYTYAYIDADDKVAYKSKGDTVAYYAYNFEYVNDGILTERYLANATSGTGFVLADNPNSYVIFENADGSYNVKASYDSYYAMTTTKASVEGKMDRDEIDQEILATDIKVYLVQDAPEVSLSADASYVTLKSELGNYVAMTGERDGIIVNNDPVTFRVFATDLKSVVPSFYVTTGWNAEDGSRMFLFNPADSVDYYVGAGKYDKEYQWDEETVKAIFKSGVLNTSLDTLATTIKGKDVNVAMKADNAGVQGGLDYFKYQIILADATEADDLYIIRTLADAKDEEGNSIRYLYSINDKLCWTSERSQALKFYIDNVEAPTANEEINAEGNVVVAGVNGAVVVKGAEGKNVIVSTILGKVVANEVVSSDNATIAAPAGIVVVSVDGESFKVVVK